MKRPISKFLNCADLELADRPFRSTERSTVPWPVDLTVDRRAQTCACLAAQWYGRPDGRPLQRVLLSGNLRPTGPVDRQRVCSLFQWRGRPGGRPVASTVRNMTVGGSTGRSTDSFDRSQRLVFWKPINWGFVIVFTQDLGDFLSLFF